MLDKEKLINSIHERIDSYKQDAIEESQIKIKELEDLSYVINKGCFDKTSNTETEKELEVFIKDNSGIWDLTDVKEFLLYNKDEVMKILQKL